MGLPPAASGWRALAPRRGEPEALPLAELVGQGLIEYIAFPEALVGKYQSFTQADLTRLRAIGCEHRFADVATGIRAYTDWLARNGPAG